MDLSEFLLARIADDEALVREAIQQNWAWRTPSGAVVADRSTFPARVLAECEAKRRIVGYCTPDDDAGQVLLRAFADPTVDGAALAQAEPFFRVFGAQMDEAMTDVLKMLAMPYADHPDYDTAWALDHHARL
jgi:hypothetical protein